jgi:cytidyltransferase-like protein
MARVVVSAAFDQLGSADCRFLQEAASLGEVHVELWSDEAARALTGREPTFPQEERLYFLQALRYTTSVSLSAATIDPHAVPLLGDVKPDVWVVNDRQATPGQRQACATRDVAYRTLIGADLAGFPEPPLPPSTRKKVIVTGCYDYFHTGHVRFFEEVSELGDLFVVVGNDENIRLLKGPGHPQFPAVERRYMAGSIRCVYQALVATGMGWLDAEPEIGIIRPDMYAVNEDGDKPAKRDYCREHGIDYVVLQRLPKPGLRRRSSTELRGF